MKSLILKDLYNIGHNAKSMLLILLVFAVGLIMSSGVESYIISAGVLCSMMIVTTFTFDDNCKWSKYALIMPVCKKDIVKAKFIVLVIFCTVGVCVGTIFGVSGGLVMRKLVMSMESIVTMLFMAFVGLIVSVIFGSMSIPLVYKFGAEKGRMLLLVSFAVPLAICFIVYEILMLFGVEITDQLVFAILCVSPLIALIWVYIMYRISCSIFSKQEVIG
ncbi:MAG: ABC-2 transporter permease [Ruminococcus sp.]|nr:ABC-2 transporter permease [Ruminococcus sp.]